MRTTKKGHMQHQRLLCCSCSRSFRRLELGMYVRDTLRSMFRSCRSRSASTLHWFRHRSRRPGSRSMRRHNETYKCTPVSAESTFGIAFTTVQTSEEWTQHTSSLPRCFDPHLHHVFARHGRRHRPQISTGPRYYSTELRAHHEVHWTTFDTLESLL